MTASNIIARDFRGTRLYLQSVHIGNGMRWTANLETALRLTMPEALKVCDRASREWGTRCAVVDTEGNLATPKPSAPYIPLSDLKATAVAKLRTRYREQSLKYPTLRDTVSEDLYVNRNLRAAIYNLKHGLTKEQREVLS